jgi:hypothetical protein
MLNERKLTERELESREVVLQGLLKNKRNLVKKYGKDAEKVMYGIATKKAKTKVEGMNKEKIKELILKSLQVEDNDPSGEYLEGDPNEKVEERVSFDDILDLRADKKDLEDRIAQLYRDMEQEAEPEGGEVADRYGSELDRLEGKLYKVMSKINDYDMNEGKQTEDELISEANINPEVTNKVNQFIKAMAKRYGYEEQDAVYAIMAALKQRNFDGVQEGDGNIDEEKIEIDDDTKFELPLKHLIQKHIKEILTKKAKVSDFVDDFKKSDAKQFKGKSDKKKKQMAVAAYLSKQEK